MNNLEKIIRKTWDKLVWGIVRLAKVITPSKYNNLCRRFYRNRGMHLPIDGYYIDPSAYFDNYDYSLFHVGKKVTISRDVLLLTHDYSLYVGLRTTNSDSPSGLILRGILIGDNCFIGAKALILPGTHINNNCIIGAGAVVKGTIPANSVVIGNPAQVVCSVEEYAEKHKKIGDYTKLPE